MPMLKGGKYDGRHSDWVPKEYLESNAGKIAQGLPVEEKKAADKKPAKKDAD